MTARASACGFQGEFFPRGACLRGGKRPGYALGRQSFRRQAIDIGLPWLETIGMKKGHKGVTHT